MKKLVIKRCIDEFGQEWLDETPSELVDIIENYNITPFQEKLIMLYQNIARMENYYQENTPTAFGDPEYSRFSGIVVGYCAGAGWVYEYNEEKIFIKSGKRVILEVERPHKTKAYYDAVKDNEKTWNQVFGG